MRSWQDFDLSRSRSSAFPVLGVFYPLCCTGLAPHRDHGHAVYQGVALLRARQVCLGPALLVTRAIWLWLGATAL